MRSRDEGRGFTLGWVVAGLLIGAAAGAVVVSRDASPVGRSGGVVAAGILAVVAAGSAAGAGWALGAAFLMGLFWLWATVALTVQRLFGPGETLIWLAWSFGVLVSSVWARRTETDEEDTGDG